MLLKVMSSNIRFDNPQDQENDWSGRREVLFDLINSYGASLLGTQEGLRTQLNDLNSNLINLELIDSHREWITERMYPCIFADRKVFDVHESGDIWLSKTPNTAGSKSFNSAFPRLCTWAVLEIKETGLQFIFINTHLDHILSATRQEQVKVLITEITKLNSQDLPLIISGDFNEAPDGEVRRLLIENLPLTDSWKNLALPEETSFHKFNGKNDHGARIDWILSDQSFLANEIKLIKDNKQGRYPSDHFPVIVTFKV